MWLTISLPAPGVRISLTRVIQRRREMTSRCEENTSAYVSKTWVKKSSPRDLEDRNQKRISLKIYVRQDTVSRSSGSSFIHMQIKGYFEVNIKPIPWYLFFLRIEFTVPLIVLSTILILKDKDMTSYVEASNVCYWIRKWIGWKERPCLLGF